jgi:YcxB-like protein
MTDPTAAGSPSVHIQTTEHRLTQDEVVPIFYRQVFHRWYNWILPAVGICLVIAGVAILGLDSVNEVAWVVTLTLGIVIMVIFVALVPLTPHRIWNRIQKQFAVRTLQISEEGISRHTELNDSTMRWAMFSELRQRDDLYLLVVGDGPGCFIIPRRAFTSEADEVTFRELAERSVMAQSDGSTSP